ncbi:hypothetical protein GCM10007939_03680 [Amylibacter marinus]|uniref:Uncharacterized protein n=1 Tax=Amylibacter marinus TaxID=1475483 RepID=A0ABQ5VRP8_9RHOB|nr:hypothetical protein [Amylibacter marinus]GLQ34085.1 hypothetical protein GCM10007939_03680 [Amylibacter marinus]
MPAPPHEHDHIKRRKVFYVPGFDPISPRRYRELYRREAALQAEISQYSLTLSALKTPKGTFGWQVGTLEQGKETHAFFEVLTWSDLVKSSMKVSVLGTYMVMLKTVWVYLSTGAFRQLTKLRRGPVVAALYPVFALLLQLIIACFASVFLAFVVSKLAPPWVGVIVGLGAGVLILRQFKKFDRYIYAYYLMQDYGYAARSYGKNPAALDQRILEFADRVQNALSQEYDEVLIVGHSSGAHVGIQVMAEVLRRGCDAGPALSLLTLGHVVPMVGFLPQAHELRRDLQYLSTQKSITWIDITAPTDSCNFALCDPVSVCVDAIGDKVWPLVISARFGDTIDTDRLEEMKLQFFKLHLQYLCHFDTPDAYDYFLITSGPISLAARFDQQPSSPMTIRKPLSNFRNTAN